MKEYLNFYLEMQAINDYYKNVQSIVPDEETYRKLVALDPTSTDTKIGNYVKWIIQKLYKTGSESDRAKMLGEDAYKFQNYLKIYDRLKLKNKLDARSKNIFNLNSINEVYRIVQNFENDSSIKAKEDIKREDVSVIYEDAQWGLYIPKSYEASCELGSGTNWCTAADSEESKNYYNDYTSQGDLYIVIDKTSNEKWQFHFESKQFMDKNDTPVNILRWTNSYDVPDQIINFLQTKDPEKRFEKLSNLPEEERTKKIMQAFNITNYTTNPDGSIDVNGSIFL